METKNKGFQLCAEVDSPFQKEGWTAELKADGRRVRVIKKGSSLTFYGRDNIVQDRFPELVSAFKQINADFDVDCEFCVFNGLKTDRGLLQTRDRTKDRFKIRLLTNSYPATAIVFDILSLNGNDLTGEEYTKRRQALSETFANCPLDISEEKAPIKITKNWENPLELWEYAEQHKLEGIVEKDLHSKYVGKRSDSWIKVKRKALTQMRFTGYEISNAGITLTNEQGFRVAVNGSKHIKVKNKIDNDGYADVLVRSMADKTDKGRLREIVYFSLED
jgi:bifunctional non-homologous end joining protein LigD